jgi:hypothetical protein
MCKSCTLETKMRISELSSCQENNFKTKIKELLHMCRHEMRLNEIDTTHVDFDNESDMFKQALSIKKGVSAIVSRPARVRILFDVCIDEVLKEEGFNNNNFCDFCYNFYGRDSIRKVFLDDYNNLARDYMQILQDIQEDLGLKASHLFIAAFIGGGRVCFYKANYDYMSVKYNDFIETFGLTTKIESFSVEDGGNTIVVIGKKSKTTLSSIDILEAFDEKYKEEMANKVEPKRPLIGLAALLDKSGLKLVSA